MGVPVPSVRRQYRLRARRRRPLRLCRADRPY